MPNKSVLEPHVTESSGSDIRYRQLEEMLELAIELQGTRRGLSYAQISERWSCSIKTAKRRVKALRAVFGDALVGERCGENGNLRFRLRHRVVSDMAIFTDDELSALDRTVELAHQAGLEELASALTRAVEKARAITESKAL